ncbi:NAD(P)H-dependent oxidoreductase [Acidovorax sp.]|uniref:FMN-dependent NADH-azoreductase n=1 Tax=Acidovorax sp. TaxID=1872122 RepID=UPI002617525E|nr:NAD(P)H-dependent oxidoreductase [Acidovorax sp.]
MTQSVHEPRLLRLDASARHADSVSRKIADAVQARWKKRHPHGVVIHRDLSRDPMEHIQQATITGFYTPDSDMTPDLIRATALSDTVIEELMSADLVLIASPMYNFTVPSALKAWIDQIMRVNRTFAFRDGQFEGLVTAPRAILALAYGAHGYQGPMASMDFLRPYLVSLLGFMGIGRVEVVTAEATTMPQAASELDKALQQVEALFALSSDNIDLPLDARRANAGLTNT